MRENSNTTALSFQTHRKKHKMIHLHSLRLTIESFIKLHINKRNLNYCSLPHEISIVLKIIIVVVVKIH